MNATFPTCPQTGRWGILRMWPQIPLDLGSTSPVLLHLALFFKHQKDFPELTSSQIQWGLSTMKWWFCIPLASSWHWLFFHRTIRVLAPLWSISSVIQFAITVTGGSRVSHFFFSEQSESHHLSRTHSEFIVSSDSSRMIQRFGLWGQLPLQSL